MIVEELSVSDRTGTRVNGEKLMTNWREHYDTLSDSEKQELYRHMLVAPVELRNKSLVRRIIATPKVFGGHFQISQAGGSRWWFAVKTAITMTYTHLFWRALSHSEAKTWNP